MRMLRAVAMAGMLALGTGACAPMMMSGYGLAFRPACPVYQAHAYRTTSIMATRQRVQQIQARFSPTLRYAPVGSTSNGMASGECR